MIRSSLRAAGAVVVMAVLGGCALLSTPDPVQMYRFGGRTVAPTAEVSAAPAVQVNLRRIDMPQAVRGDRILGVTGVEAAYVKGARWVSPAQALYAESLEAAFTAQSIRVRLVGARELTPASRSLDVDIRAFEARYDHPGAAPVVVVVAQARLLSLPDRTLAAERLFTVSQPAGANRVSAIVEAFDIATRDLNTQIVAWTDQAMG